MGVCGGTIGVCGRAMGVCGGVIGVCGGGVAGAGSTGAATGICNPFLFRFTSSNFICRSCSFFLKFSNLA